MPQLNLHFIDISIPQQFLWEELHPQHQQLVVETLARLLLKAATTTSPLIPAIEPPKENSHE